MDRHHSGLWSIRGTGTEGTADPCALQGPARRLSESLVKKRRTKGLNLKWDWSLMQQNPRITIKEIGIGFYYFYQMMLKKRKGSTPSTSERQTSRGLPCVPAPAWTLLPFSLLPCTQHSAQALQGWVVRQRRFPHHSTGFLWWRLASVECVRTRGKLPHFQRRIFRSPIRIIKEVDCWFLEPSLCLPGFGLSHEGREPGLCWWGRGWGKCHCFHHPVNLPFYEQPLCQV